MKKIFFLFLSATVFTLSCVDSASKKVAKNEACTQPTIKDPNEVKPMARMMRTMANYCDTMRIKIAHGETVDSVNFPLMPFRSAEPTDSSVLEQVFFDHATQFELAWQKLMRDKTHQKENYTAVILACTNCHNHYCSGPLKRIRKLSLDYKEQ